MAEFRPQDPMSAAEPRVNSNGPGPEPRSFAATGAAPVVVQDALQLLADDHREIDRLIAECEACESLLDKVASVERLCLALTIHAQIEEELFYPALRQAGVERRDLDEAVVEHMTVRQFVADLESAGVDDPLVDAKVRVLGDYVRRHVAEEEAQMFEAARESLDLSVLGQRLAARRAELRREAALNLKARLRASGGPAAQLAGEHPTASLRALPGPFRAASALADLALTVLPGGGRLRRVMRPWEARHPRA